LYRTITNTMFVDAITDLAQQARRQPGWEDSSQGLLAMTRLAIHGDPEKLAPVVAHRSCVVMYLGGSEEPDVAMTNQIYGKVISDVAMGPHADTVVAWAAGMFAGDIAIPDGWWSVYDRAPEHTKSHILSTITSQVAHGDQHVQSFLGLLVSRPS
jgi:hypothetical protein